MCAKVPVPPLFKSSEKGCVMNHVEEVTGGPGGAMQKTDGTCEDTVLTLEKKLRETRKQYLRALANFDNYRKRVGREKALIEKEMKRSLIL